MSAIAHDPDRCRCLDCLLDRLNVEAARLLDGIEAARSDPAALDDVLSCCYEIGQCDEQGVELLVTRRGKTAFRLRSPRPVLRPGPRPCP